MRGRFLREFVPFSFEIKRKVIYPLLMQHNRYLIYCMLGRPIDAKVPKRMGGGRVKGVVEKVVRDIFEEVVEVTIGGHKFIFREPSAIIQSGDDVVFVYGGPADLEEGGDDEALFKDAKEAGFRGETVFKVLERTQTSVTNTMRFTLGPKQPREEKRSWTRQKTA